MNQNLIQNVKAVFAENFSSSPLMIFSPGRINIIGEHTDYNDGFVFPAAVDKGIVAAFEKSNSSTSRAIAIDLGEEIEFKTEEISIQKEKLWANYIFGVIAEIQKRGIIVENFNIVFSGDIPEGAGMSSSAALENSISYGLNELFNLGFSKKEMILISQKAEHNYAGVNCGIMDQYASMFGIENNALHLDCKTIVAKPFKIELGNYQFLLINTNVKHSLTDSAYNDRRSACERVSKRLGVKALREASVSDLENIKEQISDEDFQKALFVIQEINRTLEASEAMTENNLEKLGQLIYESHNGLQHQYHVSCEELDFLVDATRENPEILGARMMGGGFGGCTINLINTSAVQDFSNEIKVAYKKKFNIECSIYDVNIADGTHVIK